MTAVVLFDFSGLRIVILKFKINLISGQVATPPSTLPCCTKTSNKTLDHIQYSDMITTNYNTVQTL